MKEYAVEDENTQIDTGESNMQIMVWRKAITGFCKILRKHTMISSVHIWTLSFKYYRFNWKNGRGYYLDGCYLHFVRIFSVQIMQGVAGCCLVFVCGIDRLILGSRPKAKRKINIFSLQFRLFRCCFNYIHM